MYFARAAFLFLTLLVLGGCAVTTRDIVVIEKDLDPQLLAQWQQHKAQASAVIDWRIRGKLAVKTGKKGGHASLRWNRSGIHEHLEVFGPLGGGRIEIDTDESGATLKDTGGEILKGPAMEPLLQARLGWPIPFKKLASWVRGLPASEPQAMQLNDTAEIASMNDGGWQVSFPQYQLVSNALTEAGTINMPRIIELNALPGTLKLYDGKGEYLGEDLFVRLIIKSWQ